MKTSDKLHGISAALRGPSRFEGHVEQNPTIPRFMSRPITAAAVNFRPVPWNIAANAERLEVMCRRAARRRPDLIVAPEGILEGYVVDDVLSGARRGRDLLAVALPLDSAVLRRFRRLAGELGACLCFGFAERGGGGVYNAALFVDNKGACHVHRKSFFSEGHLSNWFWNKPGNRLRAFDTPLGRTGVMICNERFQAPIAKTLVLDGARLLLSPTYGTTSAANDRALLARSRENGVPIVQANVGLNLLISGGEIAARDKGEGKITIGVIHVPAPIGERAARIAERNFLRWRTGEQRRIARREANRVKS